MTSAFIVDDNEVFGGDNGTGAESGRSVVEQKVSSIVRSTLRTRKVCIHPVDLRELV